MKTLILILILVTSPAMANKVRLAENIESGYSAEAWQARSLCYYPGTNSWDILLDLFKDDTALIADRSPVKSEKYTLPHGGMPLKFTLIGKRDIQEVIKSIAKFSGASDL